MNFDGDIGKFLSGDSFSNGLEVTISKKEKSSITRIEFLESLAAKKRIIHLGCCDHLPIIDYKIQQNIPFTSK